MKYLFSQITKLNLLFLIGILVVLTGCTPQNHEGFAIYLTQDNISWDKMPAFEPDKNCKYTPYRNKRHRLLHFL